MQADDLQKYIQKTSSAIKKMSLKEPKSNEQYHEAIRDVTNLLDEERTKLIECYKFLKERNAL